MSCIGCVRVQRSPRRFPSLERLRIVIQDRIGAQSGLGLSVALLLLDKDQAAHARRRATQVIAHFELSVFSLILDLQCTVFSLLGQELALCVAALLGTRNVTQNVAIFSYNLGTLCGWLCTFLIISNKMELAYKLQNLNLHCSPQQKWKLLV